MKVLAAILIILASNISSFSQTAKEQKFNSTVKEIISAFSKQESAKVLKFIKKDIGIYLLHRVGAFNDFKHYNSFSFSDPSYPTLLLTSSKGIKILPIKYSSLPTYSCEKESWSKKGLFVDTTKIDHLLSKTCKDRNKYVPDNIPQQKIKYFFDLENKSRRVVINDDNGKELVFYLTYINSKWFLTIIDDVSSDCSV